MTTIVSNHQHFCTKDFLLPYTMYQFSEMFQVAIITMDAFQLVHYPYTIQYRILFKYVWRQIEAIIEQFLVVDIGMGNIQPRIFLYIKTNMGLHIFHFGYQC